MSLFFSSSFLLFVFRQTTAYDMRISVCSSDVCSSDLFCATTHGHRFLAPAVFDVIGFDDYRVKLAHAKVMLDPAERRKLIAEQAAGLAKNAGVTVKDDAGLLDECAGLV